MASSSLRRSSRLVSIAILQEWLRVILEKTILSNLTFVMSFGFIFLAIVVAPEKPEQFASICEKHNPVIACEVW